MYLLAEIITTAKDFIYFPSLPIFLSHYLFAEPALPTQKLRYYAVINENSMENMFNLNFWYVCHILTDNIIKFICLL